MRAAKGRRGNGTSREAKKKKSPRKRTAKRKGEAAFEFLDHPADVGFLARGNSLEELFAAASGALCDYGWRLENVRPRQTSEVRVRAASLEDLLYSWLSELLFLTDAEGWVFKRFSVEQVEPTKAGGISPPW
ncbi:MAG: archease, partial [Candidatus Acidoferrales bacterium]